MTGFGNFDIKPLIMRSVNEKKQEQKLFVSQTSEELNRVLVLTLARSIHITGGQRIFVVGLGTHLFAMVPRPGDSEVTFSVFESSYDILLPV